MTRVCHLTSVHPRHDLRIFGKECVSLTEAGYDVHLVVGDGGGNEIKAGIHVWDAGHAAGGRAGRMVLTSSRVLLRALKVDAEIYHFHDPELIPAGILLRMLGRQVIYDVHEDVARSLDNRPWVPASLRKITAMAIEHLEAFAAKIFSLQIVVTPEIARRFPSGRTVLLRNFPIQAELRPVNPEPYESREPIFAYIGTVSPDRGALIMVQAINHPVLAGQARLVIGGTIESKLIAEMKQLDRQGLVTFRGHLGRQEVAALLGCAKAGLVLLQPVKAHMDAYPVKLFEYMAAGLPIIASNHPLWRNLLNQGSMALMVDPTDSAKIATAMLTMLKEPDLAKRLAQQGAEAVRTRYNWESEKGALLGAYNQLRQNIMTNSRAN